MESHVLSSKTYKMNLIFFSVPRIIENFIDYNDDEKCVHLCQTVQKYVSQFIENSYQKRVLIMYNHV